MSESIENQARAWIEQYHPGKLDTAGADLLIAAYVAGQASNQERITSLQDTVNFVARWVERGLFDKDVGARDSLKTIAHYPEIPFKRGRWDVDHKPYAQAFYEKFPKAKGD